METGDGAVGGAGDSVSGQREAARRPAGPNLVKARAVLHAASLTPDVSKLENSALQHRYSKLETGNREFEIGDLKFEIGNLKSQYANPKMENGDSKSFNGQTAPSREHGGGTIENRPCCDRQSTIENRQWQDSPAYGTGLTRGLCAVSLRRSARLIGESAAGFDRHVARFLEALGPRDGREHNLARGIAETVWRRLRVFGGQANWERARLVWVLRRACVGTLENAGWTAAELGSELESKIQDVFSSDDGLLEAADKLNARLERLTRLWIEGRGGKPGLFQHSTAPGARDARLLNCPAEVMGNPFLPASKLEARLAGRAEGEFAEFPKMWRLFDARTLAFEIGIPKHRDRARRPPASL